MDKQAVARELVAVARSLIGATKDLASLKALIPEVRKKQKEYTEMQERMLRERNQMWENATHDLTDGTNELLGAIRDELTDYFNKSGKGVRRADADGGLVEVFLGSDDGVKRYQSKVSCSIYLTFEGSEKAKFMLRNEMLDAIDGALSDKGTVAKLIQAVKAADKKGFWSQGEED